MQKVFKSIKSSKKRKSVKICKKLESYEIHQNSTKMHKEFKGFSSFRRYPKGVIWGPKYYHFWGHFCVNSGVLWVPPILVTQLPDGNLIPNPN